MSDGDDVSKTADSHRIVPRPSRCNVNPIFKLDSEKCVQINVKCQREKSCDTPLLLNHRQFSNHLPAVSGESCNSKAGTTRSLASQCRISRAQVFSQNHAMKTTSTSKTLAPSSDDVFQVRICCCFKMASMLTPLVVHSDQCDSDSPTQLLYRISVAPLLHNFHCSFAQHNIILCRV